MSHQTGLCQWTSEVSRQMPHLRKSQATVLAMYSYGMVMTRRSGMSSIAHFLGELEHQRTNTVRQRLREFCYDAHNKRGQQRREVDVTTCFVALLKWILSWWGAGERRLVLVLDASTLGETFIVLALSVVYRGCAIPVAWTILPSNVKEGWKAHWLRLLTLVKPAIPKKWKVLVLTDRGLYAKWLFEGIRKQGWHPFMRIKIYSQYRLLRSRRWRSLRDIVAQNGRLFARRVVCFKTRRAQLTCTLLALWQPNYQDPWLIITDLPVNQACIVWYAFRAWVECGFKDFKRGGWHWEHSKMTHPRRAERLWLIMSVATLWVLSVGGQADAAYSSSCLPDLPRPLSCFVVGLNLILVAALRHEPLPYGSLIPGLWPPAPS